MANGGTRVIYNTRERLLSTDPNNAQAYASQATADVLRFLFDAQNEVDLAGGGIETVADGSATLPPRGIILNGVRPRPEIGTTNLFIEPGVAMLVDTAAPTATESRLTYCVDPGVQAAGTLVLTPGAGATRIDVIECQAVDSVLVTDSRDIFNPATGLFSPAVVNKVAAKRLTYRIRTGVAGAGFPGFSAGWLPLAVCSVPAAAATWDAVTVWDVRPLASDRQHSPFQSNHADGVAERHHLYTDTTTAIGEARLYGSMNAQQNGYRAGGRIHQDGLEYLDLRNANNQQNGFPGFVPSSWWYLYLVFPFGLPRWVRYSPAASGQRVPRGLRGIPTISNTAPLWNGTPSADIRSPLATGLIDPLASTAVIAAAGRTGAGPYPLGVNADGRVFQESETEGAFVAPDGGATKATSVFTLTDGVSHPANASALWCELTLTLNAAGAPPYQFASEGSVYISGKAGTPAGTAGTYVALTGPRQTHTVGAAGSFVVSARVRVPLQAEFSTAPRTFKLTWDTNVVHADVTYSSSALNIRGWECTR